MPFTVRQTKPSGYSTARVFASETHYLNHGSLGANSPGETVLEMSIAKVWWTGGEWDIKRGSNTVLYISNTSGMGFVNARDEGLRLELNDAQLTSNVVITKVNGNGTLLIQYHKRSAE